MAWIKRNLLFVIGGLVAVGMLGWAGYYNLSRWKLNNDVFKDLEDKYTEIQRLNNLRPHPGNKQVDNIEAARAQQGEMQAILARQTANFVHIPAIPPSTNLTSQDFAAALRQTIDQLQRDAYNASVLVPPRYNFSFEAQRQKVLFAPGSLTVLATQLGEVKAICDVLYSAKVNSMNGIRRERTADDASGQAGDYTGLSSETNELAVLTPYEITFQCFTGELAAVLDAFAVSPYGMVVKSLNVESASAAPREGDTGGAAAPAAMVLSAGTINERQLRITMLVEIVKLLPGK